MIRATYQGRLPFREMFLFEEERLLAYTMIMRIKHPIFILAVFKLALLATVHQLALLGYWYWQYPWLDTSVHFLAGITIGLFVTWFVLAHRTHISPTVSLYLTLAVTLAVGVMWEFFEVWVGIPRESNFVFDTKMDIIADIFGGLVANLIARKFFL